MIVTALVLGPIFIGLTLYALPRGAHVAARTIAAIVAALGVVALIASPNAPDASLLWLSRPFTASFHFGYGPLSYPIVMLLSVATFCAALALAGERTRDHAAQLLILFGAMDGVFLSKDLLLFALFWDLMLLPVFITMIGNSTHAHAAWKYLIYNLVGGLALLLATAATGVVLGTTDAIGTAIPAAAIGSIFGIWIFAGYAFAFAVKTPVWPFHTWMPDTYADLPPSFAAVVSGIQSKAGLYGFLTIALPLLTSEMALARPLMFVLGLIALLYGAFAALVERDAKRVVAYSSLSHLGLILLAVFSGQPLAIAGAAVYIVAHGYFSAALFLGLGAVEAREETRDLTRLGGLGARNPKLAGALMIGALAALGLPGLAGFAGEILILSGLFRGGYVWPAIISLVPIVLAAGYMLRLFQGIMNGPELPDLPQRRDLTWREGFAIVPLVIALVWIGVNPSSIVGPASTVAPGALNSTAMENARVLGSR